MPLNCVAPKPDNTSRIQLMGGLPVSVDPGDMAYSVQTKAQSYLQNTLNHITLKFEEIVYKVKIEQKGSCLGGTLSTKEKTILNGLTGTVCPGEILAMLGPSGSGKTTLLTALGGRLTSKLSGKITYNGQPISGHIRRQTGFVAQDDVLYPYLTVFETLLFTALLRLPKTHSFISQVQIAMLFFFSVFWSFYPLYNACFTFPQERRMLIKERSSRMYHLSSYFLAKTVGDLPLELALPTAFTFIIYWMGGLKPEPGTFILSLLAVLYSVLVAQSLGLAFGALLMDVKKATTLSSVTSLIFLAAGGYYIQQIPTFIVWLKYLSYSYYCYKLLLGIQYNEEDFYECSKGVYCRVADLPTVKSVGLQHLWIDVLILTLMLIGYRFIAYLALNRVR